MAGTPQAPTEFDVGRLDIVVSRDQIAPSVPGQPAQGAVTQNSITISWSASTDTGGSGLKGYDVERNGAVIAIDVPTTSYVDTGLSSGATYTYRVRARDNAGNVSAFSAARNITTADTTAPTVPVISAAALSSSELQVSLVTPSTDPGSGLRDYTLQVSNNGTSGWSDLATGLQAGSFPYTHGGLAASTQRYYRLRAFDNVGNASTSAVVNATTQAATDWQDIPSMTFDQGTASSISFAAQAPAGSTAYIIGTAGQAGVVNTSKIAELAARGITLDSANQLLAYDGVGTAGSVSGVILEDVASAAADWQSRISGPGVVWYHNFDSAAEVAAFRWTGGYAGGNDPGGIGDADAQYVQWVASGGADGGGYMQLTRNSPSMDGNYWYRPFNPLTGASNGRGQDDPGANGTIAPQTFIATQGGSQLYNWAQASNPKHGWYGHSSYQDSRFDGTDFYVQVRVMADPRRTSPGNIQVGKFTSFTTTNFSYTAQELVTYAGYWEGAAAVGKANIHNMYRGVDYSPIDSSIATGQINPVSPKWAYSGGWDTLLYHVTPGTNGGTGANRTRIEVWGAHPGETSYTKCWDCYVPMSFDPAGNSAGTLARPGWNAMLCWIYHNGASMSVFWQRYDQIIFSKAFIACPQV